MRKRADYVIDTTSLSTKKLRDRVLETCLPDRERRYEMSITVTSFGFKYVIPLETDLVFDVRFLTNPLYV